MSKFYHISDVHLSFKADGTVQKPMDKRSWSEGSPNYVDYLQKISDFGQNIITDDDFVAITGDLVHDMKNAHAIYSFRWLRANIKGTIFIVKGNHDRYVNFGALRLDHIGPNFYMIDENELMTVGPYTVGCYSDHDQKSDGTDWSTYKQMATKIIEQAKLRETIPVMLSHYPLNPSATHCAHGLTAYLSGHVHCTSNKVPSGTNWDWYNEAAKPTDKKTIHGCFFSTGTTDVLLQLEGQIFREITCLEVKEADIKSTNSFRDKAGKAFKCKGKFVDKFEALDPFTPGNRLSGFICRSKGLMGGSLYITHVNGQQVDPQTIYGTPKLAYPYKEGTDKEYIQFKATASVYIAEKWNGTNVLFYKYYDANGNMYMTAKTKGTAVIKDSDFGNFFTLTKEALGWDGQGSIMLDLPDLLMPLVKDNLQSISFELCGSKEPHLVKYDFEIALKPLFTTKDDGRITPCLTADGVAVEGLDPAQIANVCIGYQNGNLAANEAYREANGLKHKYEYEHFAVEGKVLYLLDYHGISLDRVLYKIKPKDVEEVHWQMFDSVMRGRVSEAQQKLNRDGLDITEESLRAELDMGPKEWDKFGREVMKCISFGQMADERQVVVLVGLPGSGKSTFAKEMESLGWVRVNQDDLGSRNKCKILVEESFRQNRKVVIDRCNFDVRQRKAWLDLAKLHGVKDVDAVVFNTPIDVCKANVLARTDHPTLPALDTSMIVVDKFAGMMVPITPEEGFKAVTTINDERESTLLTDIYRSALKDE